MDRQPWGAAAKSYTEKIKSRGGSEDRISQLEPQEGGKLVLPTEREPPGDKMRVDPSQLSS